MTQKRELFIKQNVIVLIKIQIIFQADKMENEFLDKTLK